MGMFDGKTVIITGAGKGQGKAHALAFAREGADLVISDLYGDSKQCAYALGTQAELEKTAKECREFGHKVISVECDITSESQVQAMVDTAVKEFGKIDVLVNNAGWVRLGLIHEVSEEEVAGQINTNLLGTIRCCRLVTRQMVKQQYGCIVNISSTATRGMSQLAPYIASKHGVIGLTKALALELAPHNIRVNCVLPGTVATDMVFGLSTEQMSMSREEGLKLFTEQTYALPNVIIYPEDISEGVLFVAHHPKLTGAFLPVDAGALLTGKI